MNEAVIGNGCASVPAGAWLAGRDQPAAGCDAFTVRNLRGLIVPDRGCLQTVETLDTGYFASAERPFLTRFDALPDEDLHVASGKVLLAPAAARQGGRRLKLVPMSFSRSVAVTTFRGGWVVSATASRVTRVAIGDGESLMVRPEALVAWTGPAPSGYCPKLRMLDILLPRGPKNLLYSFHGPAVVWFEGSRGNPAGRTWGRRVR